MGSNNGTLALSSNGTSKRKRTRQFAANPTANYRPHTTGWWGYGSSVLDGEPIFTWFDIPRMMRDPQVIFISHLWRAPFQKVKWDVKANNPRVANFVTHTLRRFWRGSLPHILSRYFRYGYGVGGVEYEAKRGWTRFDQIRALECPDVTPHLYKEGERQGQFAGFELRSLGTKLTRFVAPPHAFWFAGYQEFGQFYDRPPLSGMFAPWLEKRGRNGAIHLRRLWFRKHAADGGLLRYPPGTTNCGTTENPQIRDNQDVAREIMDYKETLSTLCLENTLMPAGIAGVGGDKYEWDYTPSKGNPDVAGFREYPKDLDLEMLVGAGIPPEVVQSAESGSGYNGRLMPYQGFLSIVDELSGVIVRNSEAWMTPLVVENFGPDAWYEVQLRSLADQVEEEQLQKQKRSGEFPAKPTQTNSPLPFTLSTVETALESLGKQIAALSAKVNAPLELATTRADGCANKPHKFSSTSIMLPPNLAEQFAEMAARIPDGALAEDGRENEPHVTVRYGLHTDNPEPVREIVEDLLPLHISLGEVSVFRGADSGKDYDVLKVDVSSPDLRHINRLLATLPHTDTFKEYRPHVTIAYVKAGLGEAFAALAQPIDADFTAKEIVFSSRNGMKTTIPLTGQLRRSPLELATTNADDDQTTKQQAFAATTGKLMRSRKATIAQLLALAMVRAQQRATAAGKPDAAAGTLSALSELAGDPMQVARIVGMKVEGTNLSALELGWSGPFQGARHGTFWLNDETHEKRYQKTKPGERKEKQQASEKRGWEIIHAVAGRKATLEEVKELETHLPVMRSKELMKARAVLEANLRGERKKTFMVQRLLDHVELKAGTHQARAPEKSRAKNKFSGTVTEAISHLGGIDPNSHEFLTHYDNVKEAIEDGIPARAFKDGHGQPGRGGLDTLATELQSSGYLKIPQHVSPSKYVLEQLKKGAKVHGEEDYSKQEKAEAERQKALFGNDEGEYVPTPGVEEELRREMEEALGIKPRGEENPEPKEEIPAGWGSMDEGVVRPSEDSRERERNSEEFKRIAKQIPTGEKEYSTGEKLSDAAKEGVAPHAIASAETYLKSLGKAPPPPKPNHVRLYRGEFVGKAPHENSFFSDERGLAGVAIAFAKGSGRHLVYVDVPKDVAEEGLLAGGVTDGEYQLPEEYRKQIKAWGSRGEKEEPPTPPDKEEEPRKKPKNTPVHVEEAEAKKRRAAVAYNALLEAAQKGANEEEIARLHDRAKAHADGIPEVNREQFIRYLDDAAKGHGKAVKLPDEEQVEDVNPDEELPSEEASRANEEALRALASPQSDKAPEEEPEEKGALEIKTEKARDAWQAAVKGKKTPAEVARLRKRFDEYLSALPKDKQRAIQGLPNEGSKKAAANILAEEAGVLARRRAMKSTPAKEPEAAKEEPPAPVAPPAPPEPPKKPTDKATVNINDPHALATAVHDAARQVPSFAGGAFKPGGKADVHKAFISNVYDHMKGQGQLPEGTSLDEFKHALLRAHVAGTLELSRNDLPQIVPAHLKESMMRSEFLHPLGVGSYHAINAPSHVAETPQPAPVAPPAPRPAPPPEKKPRGQKQPAHIAAVQKVADAADPIGKDYIESALHNHNGTPEDLAKSLGAIIEERTVGAQGEVNRKVPPEAIKSVRKALVAMGATEEGAKRGAQTKMDGRLYEPLEGAWSTGEPVKVVRPALVLGGKVVSRGVVERPSKEPEKKADAAGGMKAPWQMTAEESKTAGIKYYRTAQGSLYAVNPKTGQTIRVKSNHAGVGHDATDVGLKTPSTKTVYVDPQIVSALSTAGLTGPDGKSPKARVVIHNGKATLLTKNGKTGQWGSTPSSTNVPISNTPAKGLAPLELWHPRDDVSGHEAYSGMHAGNAITEEVGNDVGHKEIVAAAKAAGKPTS